MRKMKIIFENILRSALAVVFFTTLGAGFAQAQFSNSIFGNLPDCSGRSSLFNNSLSIVALTGDQRLVCFNEFNPGFTRTIGTVSGLTGTDTALVGMDFRVQDGNLYGVGNGGGVYRINVNTGAATFVNSLTVALNGTSFGVDFNPAADRLRIISDTGQNLRHNVNAGGTTINDGTLNYAMVTATGVTGAAYTNNDLDAGTATTLYDIDSNLDLLVTQAPPNDGTLNIVGALGVNTTAAVGFDIYSTIRNGSTAGNEGFASLTSTSGVPRFVSVSLSSGSVTNRGVIGFGFPIVDIAIPLAQR